MQWMCNGCAMDVQWMCNGSATDVQWKCNGGDVAERCNGVTFVPAPNPGVGAERAPAVADDGAAGHLQLADEVPTVGQRAGPRALVNQLLDAMQPVILGAGGGFHVFKPVPLDDT